MSNLPWKRSQPLERDAFSSWKGKKRDEGNGGNGGMIVSMKMVGDGQYSAIYTVPVTVGSNNQQFGLQVDTGSSDMWIASTSCSSSACTASGVSRYNPSVSSTSTDQTFNIPYLSGSVSGPIVWDTVTLGSYAISNQALAGATTVVNETLQPSYSGILGLALPLNSVILQDVTGTASNGANGATFLTNLFSTTSQTPSQTFMSLLLERPGTSRVPSLLGIGLHPSDDYLSSFYSSSSSSQGALTIDSSKVSYSSLASSSTGALFWKDELRAVTVYVNGQARSVSLGQSVSGSAYPEAVLDTGVPYIIATPSLANAIWGSLGINPASDGNYYVPCETPLNLTITLGNRGEIPLHPLDLTATSQSDPSSKTCVGLIQQDSALENPNLGVGDIILGVPFLRNVYTVLAFDSLSSSSSLSSLPNPRLGLLNITDPTGAMDEFNSVRVLGKSLGSSSSKASGGDGSKISVGLEVLFGLAGFVALCVAAFLARWYFVRRQMRKGGAVHIDEEVAGPEGEGKEKGLAASLARRSHEELKEGAAAEHITRDFAVSSPSINSQRTLVDGSRHSKHGSFSKADVTSPSRVNILVESDGEESAGEGDGAMMSSPMRRRREEEGWRESWFDAYSVDQPALHGEWRPDSGSSPRSSIRELRASSSSDRRASNLSTVSSSHGLLHHNTPPHTPTIPLLPLESRLDASLRASTVESLSDYAIGLPPPSEFGVLGSRRGSIGDTMLGFSASAPVRPRLQARSSSGLRSMTNADDAQDMQASSYVDDKLS